jgi:hypothetical protein
MADRPIGLDVVDAQLRDLAADLDTGPAPNVTGAVMTRVATVAQLPPARFAGTRRWARRRFTALLSLLVASLLVGLVVAVPGVRATVADLLAVAGVTFDDDRPQPPAPTVTPPGGRLGDAYAMTGATTVADARRTVPFRVPLPAGYGPPAEVYAAAVRPVVTLLWPAGPGLPALPGSRAGLLVDVFDDERGILVAKLTNGVRVEQVEVNGRTAFWVPGPHGLIPFGPDGLPNYERERTAGRTLLIDRGDATIRIESQLGRDAAVALAESLR